MGRKFTALENFTSDETRSEYVEGMTYEAQESDEVLMAIIDEWITEGRVREGGPESEVSGEGKAE